MDDKLIISTGTLKENALAGKTVVLTGGGGGIGFEAARSFVWLGAKVILAEIDKEKGMRAEKSLTQEFGAGKVFFEGTDIGSEARIRKFAKRVIKKYGPPDVLFNNATIAPIGAVHTVGIKSWDKSYRVNLKGPVMLAEVFLPMMLEKKSGVVVFVPSSGAAPYMGAYEVFKTAQVELSNTLAGELEGTGVYTYSIGPGIVKTDTANTAIEQIAPLYGKTVDEFYEMNKSVLISPEEAGAGFAASVAFAERYNGTETSSLQALTDAGIHIGEQRKTDGVVLEEEKREVLLPLIQSIVNTLTEQAEGWQKRVVFERQWILRDFKKHTGMAPERLLEELRALQTKVEKRQLTSIDDNAILLWSLNQYYQHQMELLRGYEKNKQKLQENMLILNKWADETEKAVKLICNKESSKTIKM